MSKKEERRKRQEQKRKESIRLAIICGVVALLLIVGGIVGYLWIHSKYSDYADSKDIRKVDAEVLQVEVHSRKNEYDTKVFYWKADVIYNVDGTDYEDEKEFDSEVKVGDIKKIEVYQDKRGDYRVPTVVSGNWSTIVGWIFLGVAGLGVLVGIAAVIVALPDDKNKGGNGKGNNKNNKNNSSGSNRDGN